MPKIARFHQTGGSDVLKLDDMPSREPAPGEVRLRCQAFGLNRAELMFMQGVYLEPSKTPSRIGYEAAGVVEAVGGGVDKSWIGRQVATIPSFSMGQYGVLGEEAIVPVGSLGEYPPSFSPEQGAAIWMQYITAYGALLPIAEIRAGDAVLIPAASSSVGLAAIQIVKGEGAMAIATTRTSKKRAMLLELGADHVIATAEEDLAARVKQLTAGKGARVIFDPVAGSGVEKLADAAAAGGIIIEYGLLAMEPTPFPLMAALSKGLTVRGYTMIEITGDPARLDKAKQFVYQRLEDGRFQPKIAKTFPLSRVVDAYKYMESNEQIGKVVVTV